MGEIFLKIFLELYGDDLCDCKGDYDDDVIGELSCIVEGPVDINYLLADFSVAAILGGGEEVRRLFGFSGEVFPTTRKEASCHEKT